jgi:hypothetical protein
VTYAAELWDSGRQQVRYGYASNTLFFWPKQTGVGNIAVSGTATYEVHKPGDGASSSALASGNATEDHTNVYSRLSCTVDCSNTSLWQLNVYYYWILWTYTYASVQYTFEQSFDVMRDPWTPTLSLNDLIEEVSDMERRCTAQAARLKSGRTAEQHASVIGFKAWGDVWLMLEGAAEADGILIPSLVFPKEAVHRIVVAQTIHRLYAAEGGAPGTTEALLADEWAKKAHERFLQLPPMRYLAGDNRAPVTPIQGFSVQTVSRGRW